MSEASPICEVHGCPTHRQTIRVIYGLRRGLKQSPAYLVARRELFPNCGDWVNGGSIVRNVQTARNAVCLECITARDAYLLEHHPTWLASHDSSSE